MPGREAARCRLPLWRTRLGAGGGPVSGPVSVQVRPGATREGQARRSHKASPLGGWISRSFLRLVFAAKYPEKFARKYPQKYPEPYARLCRHLCLHLNDELYLDLNSWLHTELDREEFAKSLQQLFRKSFASLFGKLFN